MRIKDLAGFLDKAKTIHGDKYNYSNSIYLGATTKLEIICSKHGSFWQIPAGHLDGKGCQKCARELVGSKTKYTTEEFIALAKSKHGDKYDYSETLYGKSNTDPLKIICKQHGAFQQKPMGHLAGQGCFHCGVEVSRKTHLLNTEIFIKNAESKHGKTYCYSKSIYTSSANKLIITCTTHGDFSASPNSHLMGTGCPSCSKTGFKVSSSAIFYVFVCDGMVKIGITNKSLRQRLNSLKNSSKREFNTFLTFHSTGQVVLDLETKLLRKLSIKFSRPDYLFNGCTETFVCEDTTKILKEILYELQNITGELNVQHATIS